jgi:hypothetical protein
VRELAALAEIASVDSPSLVDAYPLVDKRKAVPSGTSGILSTVNAEFYPAFVH